MSADDPKKIDPAELDRMSTPPIRPEPKDEGIAAGGRGDIENDVNPDDAEPDDLGIGLEDLPGSNTETIGNAAHDRDGDRDDAPDSDNPNDYGED